MTNKLVCQNWQKLPQTSIVGGFISTDVESGNAPTYSDNIYIASGDTAPTCTMSGGTVSSGSAKNGGGIYITGLTANLTGTTFKNNSGTNGGTVYCASKAAVNAYSRHVAFTYMKEGIRSNIIAPGGIATEIASSMGMPNMDGFARVKPVQALAPAPGQPSDIANAALFLASDDSAYISGVILPVDGGWSAF